MLRRMRVGAWIAVAAATLHFTACSSLETRAAARTEAAASNARDRFAEWYGAVPADAALELPALAPLTPASALAHERAVAAVVARSAWSPPHGPDVDAPLRQGLVEYSVERLMRDAHAAGGFVETRYFGGALPWVARALSAPRVDESRAARALVTLERYLGWPVLQEVLIAFRERHAGRTAGVAELVATSSDVTGRDLSWLIDIFDPHVVFDYAVDEVQSGAAATGFRTEVVIRRHGGGQFTGTVRPRIGPFESGRGVAIAIVFADGQQVVEWWDGRDAERRYMYESPQPVSFVEVDPDRVLAVDARPANNRLAPSGTAWRSSLQWSVRWGAWLQDRLLWLAALI